MAKKLKVTPWYDASLAGAPAKVTPWNEANLAGAPNKAAASAPAYSPPAQRTPAPPDPAYQAQIAALARQRDSTLSDLSGQQSRSLLDYGYNASYDQAGGVSGLSFDPSNPFSRAALLQKSYQQNKSGTLNSMAARGQLYAGALQQAQDVNDTNYQQSNDSLQKQLIASLAGIQAAKTKAGTDYEFGSGQALGTSTQNATSNPLYTPTVPAPAPRKVAKTVNGTDYYLTASGRLAPIPKGASIIG